MTDTLIAIAVVIAALAATWFGGRKSGKTDAKSKTAIAEKTEALKQERERNARDAEINGAADLAALARRSGVVRHTEH